MPKKRKWQHILDASKQEALLAVELYNRGGEGRRLEAFIIHMHLAWLHLLHARFNRDKIDYMYRDGKGNLRHDKKGQPRSWDLTRCLRQEFSEDDPIRRNAEFFIGLRDRVEHRYERALGPIIAGKAQSHVLNYEETLVRIFGKREGLADQLRFPVFLSSLTEDAAAALRRTFKELPARITRYVEAFDGQMPTGVRDDYRYEFRVTLFPQTGPPSEADAAMKFVRWDDLTEDQRSELEKMQTIIREKRVPVSGKDFLKPTDVARRVAQKLGVAFSPYSDHPKAWRHYKVRPPKGAARPDRTRADFCVWDEPHGDYVYTEAWVNFLVKELRDKRKFRKITGHDPVPTSD